MTVVAGPPVEIQVRVIWSESYMSGPQISVMVLLINVQLLSVYKCKLLILTSSGSIQSHIDCVSH